MHKIVVLRHRESVWNKENQHWRKRAIRSCWAQSDLNRRAKHGRLKFISWGSL